MHLCRSLLLAASFIVSVTAGEAELALTSGRTVRGEIVSDGPGSLTLRMRSPVRGGLKQVDVTYAKSDVLRRNDVASPLQLYTERKARTPDTVPELCTLAQWCYESCLREPARGHALRVLELDPENAWARRILDNCGYIDLNGTWVDEAEYMKANNLAKVDGQLVPVAVAEARKDLARAVATRERCGKQVAELKAVLAEKPGAANVNELKSKTMTGAAEAKKKGLEILEKRLADLRQQPPVKGTEAEQRRAQISEMEKNAASLQDMIGNDAKAAAEAKRVAARDKAAAEQAKTKLPEAEAALAKAEDEVKAAAARLPADDSAAKAALAALEKPAKAAGPVKPVKPVTEVKEQIPPRPAGGRSGGKPPKDE